MPAAANSRRFFSFTLRGMFVLITILCVLSAVVAAFKSTAAAERRKQIANHYRLIGIAFANYAAAKQTLPPPRTISDTGQPLMSWRYFIGEYANCRLPAPHDPAQAWNAPVNAAARTCITTFSYQDPGNDWTTNIFGIVGPGAALDPTSTVADSECDVDVILCMDVADSKIHWLQPGDYDLAKLLACTGRLGDHVHGVFPERVYVLFHDGTIWPLSPDTPMSAIQPFLTLAEAKTHDREKLLGPYRVD